MRPTTPPVGVNSTPAVAAIGSNGFCANDTRTVTGPSVPSVRVSVAYTSSSSSRRLPTKAWSRPGLSAVRPLTGEPPAIVPISRAAPVARKISYNCELAAAGAVNAAYATPVAAATSNPTSVAASTPSGPIGVAVLVSAVGVSMRTSWLVAGLMAYSVVDEGAKRLLE
jgi:hypothetical protein